MLYKNYKVWGDTMLDSNNNSLQEKGKDVTNKKENPLKTTTISKRRYIDISSIERNIDHLMNYMLPISNNIDSIKEYLKPDIKYIVQIPKEILDKIDNGDYDFMRSGEEIIANVVDKNRPRKPVVHQLRMSKETLSNSQSKTNLAQTTQNIAFQQQLANISEKLDEIASKAEKILIGQMTDRLGFIYGSWDTYQQALRLKNNELSNALKHEVIQSLNVGRRQLLEYINSRDEFFQKLPRTQTKAFLKNLNGKLITQCSDELNSCNVSLIGIALSTVILSNIYLSYVETEVLEILTSPLTEIIEGRRKDFLLLANIAGQQDKPFDWVVDPKESKKFLDQIKTPVNILYDDFIEIEIDGYKLINLEDKYHYE